MTEKKVKTGALGNINSLKHGGEGAIKCLTSGAPFAEYAHQTYLDKLRDMGLDESDLTGVVGLLAQETSRLFTVSELFWQAMMSAASAGDFEKFEKLARRFGWISGKGIKALGTFNEANNHSDALDYEEMLKNDAENGSQ